MTLKMLSLAAVAALSLLLAPPVYADTIDFTGLTHGEKITTQISGVTISAKNTDNGLTIAAIFDTSKTGTADDDLEDPFTGGNMPSTTVLGNALIIAENDTDANGDGFLDSPDDEGSKPAGWIKFDFDKKATSIGWDMVDVESNSAGGSSVTFRATNGDEVTKTFTELKTIQDLAGADIAYGNNSLNRIDPITASALGLSDFDWVQFNIGGSMALDNIVFTPVPEPGTLLLLGVGTAGLLGASRRRKRRAA